MSLQLAPISIGDAKAFVADHRRHHDPPESGYFAVACADGTEVVGVAIVGRPVARALQDGFTCAAAWRAARALGYRRLGTYILKSEPGTSLIAAEWKIVGEVKGRSWDTPSRPRVDRHPAQDKIRWEICT